MEHCLEDKDHYFVDMEHYLEDKDHYFVDMEHYLGDMEHCLGDMEHCLEDMEHCLGDVEHCLRDMEHCLKDMDCLRDLVLVDMKKGWKDMVFVLEDRRKEQEDMGMDQIQVGMVLELEGIV